MGRQDCKTWLCHTGANRRRSLPACENACLVDETRRTNPTTNPPTTRSLFCSSSPYVVYPDQAWPFERASPGGAIVSGIEIQERAMMEDAKEAYLENRRCL